MCSPHKGGTLEIPRGPGRPRKDISLDTIYSLATAVSVADAAQFLKVSIVHLQRVCRRHGLHRWPFRRYSDIRRRLKRIHEKLEKKGHDAQGSSALLEEMELMEAEVALLIADPVRHSALTSKLPRGVVADFRTLVDVPNILPVELALSPSDHLSSNGSAGDAPPSPPRDIILGSSPEDSSETDEPPPPAATTSLQEELRIPQPAQRDLLISLSSFDSVCDVMNGGATGACDPPELGLWGDML